MSPLTDAALLDSLAEVLRRSGCFGTVRVQPPRLEAQAEGAAEPAFYRLDLGPGAPSVSLVTPARYLSQSIEADLVHTGDKLDDLLADELIDQGYAGPPLRVEHFRDPEKLFTFRSPLPRSADAYRTPAGAAELAAILRAYEACFRPLGDMDSRDDE